MSECTWEISWALFQYIFVKKKQSSVPANCVFSGSTGAPNILQEANTKPLSVSACKTAIAKHPYFTEDDVVASHICIGSLGNEGSCHVCSILFHYSTFSLRADHNILNTCREEGFQAWKE